MATARQPIVQPTNWAYTIQTNLDQGLPTIALETINGLINVHHVPMVHHFQLLLYLILEPPSDASGIPAPLTLLNRYLDLHSTNTLAPLLPSLEGKAWLNWPGIAHSLQNTYPRQVRARMEICRTRGIWALVFDRTQLEVEEEEAKWGAWREEDEIDAAEGSGAARKKAKPNKGAAAPAKGSRSATVKSERNSRSLSRSARTKADQDDEGETYEPVTARGWLLLEFLVAFWTKNATENGGVSPAFLSQLWRPSRNMAYDQAGTVVEVVRQAVYESTGAAAMVHRRIAAGLLKLLVDAASGPSPRFLVRSLTAALLPLFREERVPLLLATLRTSTRGPGQLGMSRAAATHLITHAIEDAAGILSSRNAERDAKRRRKTPAASREGSLASVSGHFDGPGLAPPTVEYALSLVHLHPKEGGTSAAHINALQQALVVNLAATTPSPLWATVTDTRFKAILRLIGDGHKKRQSREEESQETEPTLPLSRDSDSDLDSDSDSSTPSSLSLSSLPPV